MESEKHLNGEAAKAYLREHPRLWWLSWRILCLVRVANAAAWCLGLSRVVSFELKNGIGYRWGGPGEGGGGA